MPLPRPKPIDLAPLKAQVAAAGETAQKAADKVRSQGPMGFVYAAATVALVIAGASVIDAQGLRRMKMLEAECRKQQLANDQLAAQNLQLKARIDALSEPVNKAALERAAREQLGFVKPDEVVFKFE